MPGLCTRFLCQVFSPGLCAKSLYQAFMPGLFTRSLCQVCVPGLYARSLHQVFVPSHSIWYGSNGERPESHKGCFGQLGGIFHGIQWSNWAFERLDHTPPPPPPPPPSPTTRPSPTPTTTTIPCMHQRSSIHSGLDDAAILRT